MATVTVTEQDGLGACVMLVHALRDNDARIERLLLGDPDSLGVVVSDGVRLCASLGVRVADRETLDDKVML